MKSRTVRSAVVLVLTGACVFQFGLGYCAELLYIANPCGTVFGFCEPEELSILSNPVPDFENDPSCTIPFACGDPPFPPGPGPRPGGPPPP